MRQKRSLPDSSGKLLIIQAPPVRFCFGASSTTWHATLHGHSPQWMRRISHDHVGEHH